jgi:photosystem II stability/assembly factor-like uncharacterized protein
MSGGVARAGRRRAAFLLSRGVAAAAFLAAVATGPAFAGNTAVSAALNQPSGPALTANSGLFTAIAHAGNGLVAVGERGHIVLSDDDGVHWRQVQTPTSVTLTAVGFSSAQEGWAVGHMGVVLHTSDGGLTWTKQLDGLAANQALVGTAQADLAAQGSNDTTTANLQAAQQFVRGGPTVPFLSVLAQPGGKAMLAGAFGMAFTTADGGHSWNSVFDTIPNPNGLHIYKLLPDQDALFFIGEQGFVLRKQNAKFTTLTTPFSGTFFGGLLTPGKALLVYGLQGTVLRSPDAGQSWTQSPSGGTVVGIDCGVVDRNGRVLLGDVAGNILVSTDDGRNFTDTAEDEPVVTIAEAPDGAIIIGGPFGLRRLSPHSLTPEG